MSTTWLFKKLFTTYWDNGYKLKKRRELKVVVPNTVVIQSNIIIDVATNGMFPTKTGP